MKSEHKKCQERERSKNKELHQQKDLTKDSQDNWQIQTKSTLQPKADKITKNCYSSYGYGINFTPSPENSDDVAAYESIVCLQNYFNYCYSPCNSSLFMLTPQNKNYLAKSLELVRQIPLLRDEPELTYRVEDATLEWNVIFTKLRNFINKVYSNKLYKPLQDHAYMSSNQQPRSTNHQEKVPSQSNEWNNWHSQSYNSQHNNNGVLSQSITHCRQDIHTNNINKMYDNQQPSLSNDVGLRGLEAYFPNGYHLNHQQHLQNGLVPVITQNTEKMKEESKARTHCSLSYPNAQSTQSDAVSQHPYQVKEIACDKNKVTKKSTEQVQSAIPSQHYQSVIESTLSKQQYQAQITVPTFSPILFTQTITTTTSSNTSNISKKKESAFSRPWEISSQPNNKETNFDLPRNKRFFVDELNNTSPWSQKKFDEQPGSFNTNSSASVIYPANTLPTKLPSDSLSHSVAPNSKSKEGFNSESEPDDLLEQISQQDYLESLTENLNKIDNSSQSEYSGFESCAEDNRECDQSVQQKYLDMVKKFMEQKKQKSYTSVIKESPLKSVTQKKPRKPRNKKSTAKNTPKSQVDPANKAYGNETTYPDALTVGKEAYHLSGILSSQHSNSKSAPLPEKSCNQTGDICQKQPASRANSTGSNSQMVDISQISSSTDLLKSVNTSVFSQINPSHKTPEPLKEIALMKRAMYPSGNPQLSLLIDTTRSTDDCLLPVPGLQKTPPAVKASSAFVIKKTKDNQPPSSFSDAFSLKNILSSQNSILRKASKTPPNFDSYLKTLSSSLRKSVVIQVSANNKTQPSTSSISLSVTPLKSNQFFNNGFKTFVTNALHESVPCSRVITTSQASRNNVCDGLYITPPESLAACVKIVSSSSKPSPSSRQRRLIKAYSGIEKITELTGFWELGSKQMYPEERISKSITIEDEEGLIDQFFKKKSLMKNTTMLDEQIVVLSEKNTTGLSWGAEGTEKSKLSTGSNNKQLQIDEVLRMFEQEALDIQNRETGGKSNIRAASGNHVTTTQTANEGTVETRLFFGDEMYSSECDAELLSPGKRAINGMINTYQVSQCKPDNSLSIVNGPSRYTTETDDSLMLQSSPDQSYKKDTDEPTSQNPSAQESSNEDKQAKLPASLEPPLFAKSIKIVKSINSTLGQSRMIKTVAPTVKTENLQCVPNVDLKKLFPRIFLPPKSAKSLWIKPLSKPVPQITNTITKKISKTVTTTKHIATSSVDSPKAKVVLVDQMKTNKHSADLTHPLSPQQSSSTSAAIPTKKDWVRRSGRSILNSVTMARIRQCTLQGSSSSSSDEDEYEATDYDSDDVISQDCKPINDNSPPATPRDRKPSLDNMNLSPVVNVTDAKHIVYTTTTTSTKQNHSIYADQQGENLKPNFRDWLNKRQGKIQIINTPAPLPSSPPNFNLVTLSNLASKIKSIETRQNQQNGIDQEASLSGSNNNIVHLKKSKVVLQDCTSSDLTKAMETAAVSSRISSIKELSNRRVSIMPANSDSNNIVVNVESERDEVPPAKKQKKKKYWYPKSIEMESDESPVKNSSVERNLKRKAGPVTTSRDGSGRKLFFIILIFLSWYTSKGFGHFFPVAFFLLRVVAGVLRVVCSCCFVL